MRVVPAALVLLVMGCAIAGIGIGESPAEREPAPAGPQVKAAERRIAAGGPTVARGRALLHDQGCDRCHSIAAVGAGGMLGPRLDTLDEDLDEILESIAEPREDTTDGYPERLMPADYAQRMSPQQIRALAAFVAVAARSAQEDGADDDDSGHRRGRGRGRSGGGGGD